MAKVLRNLQMAINIKDNLLKINLKDMDSMIGQTGIIMKVNGKMEKDMGRVNGRVDKVKSMMASGIMGKLQARDLCHGIMETNMKGIGRIARNMDLEKICLQMEVAILGNM